MLTVGWDWILLLISEDGRVNNRNINDLMCRRACVILWLKLAVRFIITLLFIYFITFVLTPRDLQTDFIGLNDF